MILRPRPFLVSLANSATVRLPVMELSEQLPSGAIWRLDYILANYRRTVVAGGQTSPDLSFMLFDSGGRSVLNAPVNFKDLTAPAGNPVIKGGSQWNLYYPPRSVVRMEIFGQVAGPTPATISVVLYGMKGWGE